MNILDLVNKIPAQPNPSHVSNGYIAGEGLAGLIDSKSLNDGEKYQSLSSRGHRKIDQLLGSVFSGQKHPRKDVISQKEKIKDWMDKGGIIDDIQNEVYNQNDSTQMLADGGEVKNDSSIHNKGISISHPAQNLVSQAAKGRISNYLNSLRPQENTPKLAFDDEPDTTEQKKTYNKALEIAANPLSILHEINDNTLDHEQVAHFKGMFPDLDNHLQNKISEKITQAQLDGKKPSYQTRQGLGTYLGVPLSSENSPAMINAAQNSQTLSTPPPQQNKSPQKNKKGTSSLTKSDQSFLTGNQALAARQQKQ